MKVQIKQRGTFYPSETEVGVVYKKSDDYYIRIHDTTSVYQEGFAFVRFNDTANGAPTLVWLFDHNYYDSLTVVGEPVLSV